VCCPGIISAARADETPAATPAGTPAAVVSSAPKNEENVAAAGTSPIASAGRAAPVKDKGWILFGSLRARLEDQNFFPTPKANGAYTYFANTLKLGAMRQTAPVDYLIEFESPGLWNLPTQAIATAPQGQLGHGATYRAINGGQVASLYLKQGYLRLKEFADKRNSLKLGRFDFNDGQETVSPDASLNWIKTNRIGQRLLGPFGYTMITRSFDGLQFVNDTKKNNFTLMGVFPTRGAFDLNGWDSLSDIRVVYASFTQPHIDKMSATDWRIFFLHYDDSRPGVLKTDNRSAAARAADKSAIRIATYGAHYARVQNLGAGKADLLLWGAGQLSKWGVLDHGAYAITAEAGYQLPKMAWKPWLRIGYDFTSGDGDPTNNRHGTFFPVLPTARIYARYPFFFTANLEDMFAQLILKPMPRLTVRTDVHGLRLAESADLWYSGGGAFNNSAFGYTGRPSGGKGDLATLFDMSADYQLNKNSSITLYGAYANGGGVIASSFASRDSVFGYAEFNVKF